MAKFIEITNEDGSKDYLPGDPDTMMELYGTNTFFPPKNGKKLYEKNRSSTYRSNTNETTNKDRW